MIAESNAHELAQIVKETGAPRCSCGTPVPASATGGCLAEHDAVLVPLLAGRLGLRAERFCR